MDEENETYEQWFARQKAEYDAWVAQNEAEYQAMLRGEE